MPSTTNLVLPSPEEEELGVRRTGSPKPLSNPEIPSPSRNKEQARPEGRACFAKQLAIEGDQPAGVASGLATGMVVIIWKASASHFQTMPPAGVPAGSETMAVM